MFVHRKRNKSGTFSIIIKQKGRHSRANKIVKIIGTSSDEGEPIRHDRLWGIAQRYVPPPGDMPSVQSRQQASHGGVLRRYLNKEYDVEAFYKFLDNLCYCKDKDCKKDSEGKPIKPDGEDMKAHVERISYAWTKKKCGGTVSVVFYYQRIFGIK